MRMRCACVDVARCYRPIAWSVCRSVCLSVCHDTASPEKTAAPIEMPFGLWSLMGLCVRRVSRGSEGRCHGNHFWATVCKTVHPMLSDRCPACLSVLSLCLSVCLSVTLVYCGQTVGWMKMKLGMQLGVGRGHVVLDGGPSCPLPWGQIPPIFSPYLLWPNFWMHQDAT